VTSDPAWGTGDRALLVRLLAETRADTGAAGGSWTEYLQALAEAIADRLSRMLSPLGTMLHVPPMILSAMAWTILALVAAVLVLAAVRLVTSRRRRRAAPSSTPAGEALAAPPIAPDVWALELQRRLEGADPRAALEALWWWLARRLKGREAEPSWTTRELLRLAGRSDLAAEGRVLDRLLYGAAAPAMTEVRGLALRLRRALA